MPDQAMTDLIACLDEANGNPHKVVNCQTKFEHAGGKTDGGKVFIAPDGSAVYVTDGGKVFGLQPA